MRMVAALVCGLAALALSVAGCGSGGDGGAEAGFVSCTEVETVSGVGSTKICVETTGSEAQALQQTCTQASATGTGVTATYAAAPCSHVGALGACRVTTGGITEDGWYYNETIGDAGYTGLTSADVQMLCAQEGATFLAP